MRHLIISILSIVLAMPWIAHGQDIAPTTAPEWAADRRVALRRTVKVTWDAGIPAPDLRDMLRLMNSPKIILPAAKQALSDDKAKEEAVKFTHVGGDQQGDAIVLTVAVHAGALGGGAQKYADVLAETVGGMIRNQWRAALDMGHALRREAAVGAERELREQTARYRDLRERLREATGRTDVSPEGLKAALANLEEERQKLSLQSAGQNARRAAIEGAIKRLGEQAQSQLKDDPVAKELKVMVEQATIAHQRARELHQKGLASETELIRTRAEIAQATARVLERQETVAARSGGDLLAELTRELTTLSINSAEADAREQVVEKALARFRASAKEIDELEAALAARTRAEAALNSAVAEQNAFRRQGELLGEPQVIIRDGFAGSN